MFAFNTWILLCIFVILVGANDQPEAITSYKQPNMLGALMVHKAMSIKLTEDTSPVRITSPTPVLIELGQDAKHTTLPAGAVVLMLEEIGSKWLHISAILGEKNVTGYVLKSHTTWQP